jgi:formylglycine-generating enzyme required for sulfatase activity
MWVGVFEVTAKQYNLVEGAISCYYAFNDTGSGSYDTRFLTKNAVGCISNRLSANGSDWGGDPPTFLKDLKKRSGIKARLSTKSEWQYACRAGTTTEYNNGTSASAASMAKIGWYSGNISSSSSRPAVVGSFSPNAWGLYDMHGGQREQTSEVKSQSGYLPKASYCGGSYRDSYSGCKVTAQAWSSEPDEQNGFRVFADVE